MRVALDINPDDPRDLMAQYEARQWCSANASGRWRTDEALDEDGWAVLTISFDEAEDAARFMFRDAPKQYRGRRVR